MVSDEVDIFTFDILEVDIFTFDILEVNIFTFDILEVDIETQHLPIATNDLHFRLFSML
jgi:hypothetical protein